MLNFRYLLIVALISLLSSACASEKASQPTTERKAYSCNLEFADDVAHLAGAQQTKKELASAKAFLSKYEKKEDLRSDLILLLTELLAVDQQDDIIFYYCSSKSYARLVKPTAEAIQEIQQVYNRIKP